MLLEYLRKKPPFQLLVSNVWLQLLQNVLLLPKLRFRPKKAPSHLKSCEKMMYDPKKSSRHNRLCVVAQSCNTQNRMVFFGEWKSKYSLMVWLHSAWLRCVPAATHLLKLTTATLFLTEATSSCSEQIEVRHRKCVKHPVKFEHIKPSADCRSYIT